MEPGPDWWEASALTTALPLLPLILFTQTAVCNKHHCSCKIRKSSEVSKTEGNEEERIICLSFAFFCLGCSVVSREMMDRHFVAVCTEREVKVSYVTICTQMRRSFQINCVVFVVTIASLIDYIICVCQLCKTGEFCIKS